MNLIAERPAWPLRPWLLAALGAVAGLVIHLLLGDDAFDRSPMAPDIALTALVGSLATLIAFTMERERLAWALIFSVIAATVIGLVVYWNGTPDDWDAAEQWRTLCCLLAVAIAAPLFQSARDAGAARFAYGEVHGHAWTNVVLWFASWAFVGIVFLLAFLLSELFALIGITLLRDALREQWFILMLIGTALGAAVGVFREQDRIVRLLLGVVVAVLGVLAPVLGAGLLLFLLSLPFTGLSALWDATKATTPILISCVVGALILANAVIGRSDEEEKRSVPLRWGALALAVSMLPLAVIAAISTASRIGQYGFTPDRLWAAVFVGIACAYGLAYLYAVLRGRLGWAALVRPLNLQLGLGLCALALVLALPIVSFNAISTRDQVARLESGRVSPDTFDWAALRFDFGDPGKAAVARLAKSSNATIRIAAVKATLAEDRWSLSAENDARVAADALALRVRVVPAQVALPPGLVESFDRSGAPDGEVAVIHYVPGSALAALVTITCDRCDPQVSVVRRNAAGGWERDGRQPRLSIEARKAAMTAARTALARGAIEIRPVSRRQVFIDGKPYGEDFE